MRVPAAPAAAERNRGDPCGEGDVRVGRRAVESRRDPEVSVDRLEALRHRIAQERFGGGPVADQAQLKADEAVGGALILRQHRSTAALLDQFRCRTECRLVLRTDVDFRPCGAGNRVDAGATLDHANAQRSLGPGRQRRFGDERDGPRERVYGIRAAVVVPAMAAMALDH